jgi:hypothetical protein
LYDKKYYPGRAVAGRTFDPHYRSETVEEIPPSSEGVAFKPATWCLLGRVYRTKDIGPQHAHPRVKLEPKLSTVQVLFLRRKCSKNVSKTRLNGNRTHVLEKSQKRLPK